MGEAGSTECVIVAQLAAPRARDVTHCCTGPGHADADDGDAIIVL